MIIVPAIEAVAFYGLLRTPQTIPRNDSTVSTITTGTTDTAVEVGYKDDEKPLTGLGSKLRYVPSLLKYIIPLSLVYLFEYFINQGLVSWSAAHLNRKSILTSPLCLSVWAYLLPEHLAGSSIPIPLAASGLSNRCLHLTFICEFGENQQNLVDGCAAIHQRDILHVWSDLLFHAKHLDYLRFGAVGRLAWRRSVCQHILSNVERDSKRSQEFRFGHRPSRWYDWHCFGRFPGHSHTQRPLQATTIHSQLRAF